MQGCWRARRSSPIIGEAPRATIPTSSCCSSLRWGCCLPADLQFCSQGPVFPLQLVDLGTHLADDLEEVCVSLHGPTPHSKAPHCSTTAPGLWRSSLAGSRRTQPLKASKQWESLPAHRARTSSKHREGWTGWSCQVTKRGLMIYSCRVSFFRAELAFYTLHKSLSTQYRCIIGKPSRPLAYLGFCFSPKGLRRTKLASFGLSRKGQ